MEDSNSILVYTEHGSISIELSLVIVSIRAAPDVLRSRLVARGRESSEDIEARVERAMAFEIFGPDVVELWNDGSPEDAVERFLGILMPT